MKQNLTLLFFVLCICITNGQVASPECVNRQVAVDSLIAVSNFMQAEQVWKEINQKCEKPSQEFFTSGERILRYNLEMASAAKKQDVITKLITLYDNFDKKFPSNKNGNSIRKAVIFHQNNMSSRAEIFTLLDASFKNNRSQFTDAEALYLYFEIYNEKFLAGKENISFNQIFGLFEHIQSHIAVISVDVSPLQANIYQNLSRSLDASMAPSITCEPLVGYYSHQLETKKSDAVWLTSASNYLQKANCTVHPIFMQIATLNHNLSPTSKSAYNLAIAHFRNRDNPNAARFYEQAASISENPLEKAEIYYTLASTVYMSNDKAKAKESIMKAIQLDAAFAKSYLLLAQMYGSSANDCGDNAFEKKAINWLAANTALKAGKIDVKYKVGAEKMAENYNKSAPTKAEIKDAKMSGKVIAFKCWINESVTVPKI